VFRHPTTPDPRHHVNIGCRTPFTTNDDARAIPTMNNSQTLNRLVSDVEELLAALDDEHSPQIDELSARVEDALSAAKRALAVRRQSAVRRIGRYAKSVDGYITGFPRLGFLTGILTGVAIAYLTGVAKSDRS